MISPDDYRNRREIIWKLVKEHAKNPILVVASETVKSRSEDIPYPFRQNSDLFYLTGYFRPNGILIMQQIHSHPFTTLYLPTPNIIDEMWNGFRTTFEEAMTTSGVDQVKPIESLSFNFNQPNFFLSSPSYKWPQKNCPNSLSPYLDKCRIIKSSKELAFIKKSREITNISLSQTSLKTTFSSIGEFEFNCIKNGATGISFPTISKVSKSYSYLNGGCEYNHYCSEGSITLSNKKIHQNIIEMLKSVQTSIASKVHLGKINSLHHLNQVNYELMKKGLKSLGMGSISTKILNNIIKPSSYWIGLDINECSTIDSDFKFQNGCTFVCNSSLDFSHSGIKELDDFYPQIRSTLIIE